MGKKDQNHQLPETKRPVSRAVQETRGARGTTKAGQTGSAEARGGRAGGRRRADRSLRGRGRQAGAARQGPRRRAHCSNSRPRVGGQRPEAPHSERVSQKGPALKTRLQGAGGPTRGQEGTSQSNTRWQRGTGASRATVWSGAGHDSQAPSPTLPHGSGGGTAGHSPPQGRQRAPANQERNEAPGRPKTRGGLPGSRARTQVPGVCRPLGPARLGLRREGGRGAAVRPGSACGRCPRGRPPPRRAAGSACSGAPS